MDVHDQPVVSSSFDSPSVLIAEDSTDERNAIAHILRRQGYAVHESDTGERCIELLKSIEINALLLDLNMRDGDGFDVLSYVQEHRRGLAVILLSGMPLDEIQHHMHRLPRPELPPLLLKPIDVGQLMELLQLKLSGELPPFESIPSDVDEAM